MKTTEDSLRDLWDNITCTTIRIIGVPEEEEKKKGFEKIFEEIIVEIFFQQKLWMPDVNDKIYLKYWKKKKNLRPRLVYSARISFKINGEIKSFSDKQKLREFSFTTPNQPYNKC